MPTYNLKCTNKDCGYRWEDFMSIREKEQADLNAITERLQITEQSKAVVFL